MDGGAADGKALEPALIDEPARRQLGLPLPGRVKKLPALPSTAGSGSLAMRVAQTVSKIACAEGCSPSAASGP